MVTGIPTILSAQDSTGTDADSASDLPPAGYGTLRQDDVAIAIRTGNLLIQIIPLDEWVTRLLSPDTYASLHRLQETMQPQVDQIAKQKGIGRPTLFFVSFFGLQDQARFEPEILTINAQNRFFRPVEILPRSAQWNRRQLNQRETATAIYVYEEGIRLKESFTVSYDAFSTSRWEQSLRELDRERSRAIARAASAPDQP